MKFALCSIAGKENLYIREWVEHHIRCGFDNIIIYTTVPEENPKAVLFDYIMKGIVKIIPWYYQVPKDGFFQDAVQCPAYNDCLDNYGKDFDWIAFFDIDEFLEVDCGNIHLWFNSMQQYTQFDVVLVHWYTMNGDGKLYYENKPVQERFTYHNNYNWGSDNITVDCIFKSIVNTKTTHRFISSPHKPYGVSGREKDQLQVCSTEGIMVYGFFTYALPWFVHSHARLKHYITKSLTEYLNRKLDQVAWEKSGMANPDVIKKQFIEANEWTPTHELIFNTYVLREPDVNI